MPAIGFGLLWMSYTVGLYGYCTWKGYDVTWSQLIRPSKALTKWPPPAKSAPAPAASGSNPLANAFQPAAPIVQAPLGNINRMQ